MESMRIRIRFITLVSILLWIIIFACSSKMNLQKLEIFKLNQYNNDFIGTWRFEKTIDINGNKVDTIWHGNGWGWELATADSIIMFSKDGTYSFYSNIFQKHENGKWDYNQETKTIKRLIEMDSVDYFIKKKIILR